MGRKSALDNHLRLSSSTLSPAEEPVQAPAVEEETKPELRLAREVKVYTAWEMLVTWGLRVQGSTLKNPCKTSTGGEGSPAEEEGQIVDYVQSTPGFWESEEVLRFRFVKGNLDSSLWDPCGPGETLDFALGRRRWREYLGIPKSKIGPMILAKFVLTLENRLKEEPFVFVYPLPEADEGLVTEGEQAQWERLHPELPRKKVR